MFRSVDPRAAKTVWRDSLLGVSDSARSRAHRKRLPIYPPRWCFGYDPDQATAKSMVVSPQPAMREQRQFPLEAGRS
jgi:hypothetical protein